VASPVSAVVTSVSALTTWSRVSRRGLEAALQPGPATSPGVTALIVTAAICAWGSVSAGTTTALPLPPPLPVGGAAAAGVDSLESPLQAAASAATQRARRWDRMVLSVGWLVSGGFGARFC
jgi:hypothetical protein